MSDSKQNSVYVCPLSSVADIVSTTQANALVSVLQPTLVPDTPAAIAPDRHFKLAIDDIEEPADGLHHAEPSQVAALCAFAQSWTQAAPMVIHCYAGVSRSTAAAFVVLCSLNPNISERTIAQHLRAQSPTASPNRLIVAHGDAVLGRNGRMIKAIRAIRPAVSTGPVLPFALSATFDNPQKSPLLGPRAA